MFRGLTFFGTQCIKKHDTTTVTSLFFYIISANFSALIPLFPHLLYSSLVEEFILQFLHMMKVFHRGNDIIVT